MGIELRMPNITGNEQEQLVQIRSYLYQIIPQLQWALNNVETTGVNNAQGAAQQATKSATPSSYTPISAETTFAKLKPLIIKSADIVEAYYEEINKRLEGIYVAESDFGTFMEKTTQDIEATSSYVEQKFSDVQVIITDEVDGLKVTFDEGMDSVNTKFNGINEQMTDVNASIEQTNQEIDNVNTRIDETNELISDTNARIDETNNKIIAVENAIDNANTRIDDVNTSIAETNQAISGVNGKIDETNGKIDGLTETINNANDNIEVLIEAKNLNAEDVERLNSELTKINGTISEIDTSVKAIGEDVNTIDDNVKEIDGQVEVINTEVTSVGKRTTELNSSVVEVENSIEKTNVKVAETTGAIENLIAASSETSEKIENLNSAIADANKDIETLNAAVIETTAHIRSGVLYYEGERPVFGLEVGQRDKVNGVDVFRKYARFIADRLSFYDQNDTEVAYISDYRLFIRNVEITSGFKIGGFQDTVMADGGVVTKWLGGVS